MTVSSQISQATSSTSNGESTPHDLFVLTDEQILEIAPEAGDEAPVGQPLMAVKEHTNQAEVANTANGSTIPAPAPRNDASHNAQAGVPVLPQPPAWLAAQMKDPWSGEEARELWNGVQQARQEAAAYREAIATPEDARALKELYPGGITEARSAAERAKLLDNIDTAYFGVVGGPPEQTSAARAELAAMMLREDPAAFREMVFAGLRALENSAGVGATLGSTGANGGAGSAGGASPAPTAPSVVGAQLYPEHQRGNAAPQLSNASAHEAHVASYASFEKAANEDLERSVGAAIARTIEQALPNIARTDRPSDVGAQHAAPLQARLNAAVRQDVEAALKGDRQLGEQIAQILSARRFDTETRAQVVRLIDDRARQLMPAAAKRVINDWTQATLAAHRSSATRADTVSSRREVATVSDALPALEQASAGQGTSRTRADQSRRDPAPNGPTQRSRGVDYRKLSDEQILEM